MTKIAVYRYNESNEPVGAEGWFTLEDAEALPEADAMTAERHAQGTRGRQPVRGDLETLYRTGERRWVLKVAGHLGDGGRWVDHETDANPAYMGDTPRYRFLDDVEAIDWLTRNHYGDRIQDWLPDLPDERGPGRPEIGGRVQLRLGKLLPSVDAYAAERSCSRAEAVRLLVLAGLAGHP